MRFSYFLQIGFSMISNPQLLFRKREYIFIISHMRSYSTLLCHILGSNPQISGYVETRISYNRNIDLLKLRLKLINYFQEDKIHYFVLDKILHNYFKISQRILRKKNIHIIFLIRNPKDTVTSILNMGKYNTKLGWYDDINKIIMYYKRRLKKIMEIASMSFANKPIFIESELLLKNPSEVLLMLSQKFNLDVQLSEEYEIFKMSGLPKYGDPSPNILSGKMIQENKKDHNIFDFGKKELNELNTIYNECKKLLRSKCDLK